MTWGAIGGAAISVAGSYLMSKHSGHGGSSSSTASYDPYAPYRSAAASKLNSLMSNPGDIQNLPEYKARMLAVSRTMAAQGYTGSGNALVAAANAGGTAYQQAFQNLSTLSGAGFNPAYAQSAANQQSNYQQQANNQMWGQIGNIAGNVMNNWGSNSMPPINSGNNIQLDQPTSTPITVDNPQVNVPSTITPVQF